MSTAADQLPDAIELTPVTAPVTGVARVPGSKSITNRALLIAGLANGTSVLNGALFSDDTHFMMDSLRKLGLTVEEDAEAERITVTGKGGTFPANEADLFIGNSGTSMRFLTAALALGNGRFRIDGIPRMRQRPIGALLTALQGLGVDAAAEAEPGFPPVVVNGRGMPGGTTSIAGDQSSQYLTGLLMAAPCARDTVTIEIEGELVSKPYIRITRQVMQDFGVDIDVQGDDWRRFIVEPQRYSARDYVIEPDASNASYFFAAAAVTGGTVRVNGLGSSSHQGDLQFVRVLEQMGASVRIEETFTEVTGPKNGVLRGGTFDFNAISDTSQTLAGIAPFAEGPVTVHGVAHNRIKETDRVAAVATELRKLGQEVEEFEDGFTVHPRSVTPAAVDTYDDHRMAMGFSLVGLRAAGVVINDPACVAKTFPDYFARLGELTG